MAHTNGTASNTTFLEEVAAALAAMTPEQYIAPDQDPKDGELVLCKVSERLKRLWSYQMLQRRGFAELSQQVEVITTYVRVSILGGSGRTNIAAVLENVSKTDQKHAAGMAANLKELEAQMSETARLIEFLGNLFWIEAHQLIPAPHTHSTVGIRSDWSIVACSGESESLEEMLANALGRGGHGRSGRPPFHSSVVN